MILSTVSRRPANRPARAEIAGRSLTVLVVRRRRRLWDMMQRLGRITRHGARRLMRMRMGVRILVGVLRLVDGRPPGDRSRHASNGLCRFGSRKAGGRDVVNTRFRVLRRGLVVSPTVVGTTEAGRQLRGVE